VHRDRHVGPHGARGTRDPGDGIQVESTVLAQRPDDHTGRALRGDDGCLPGHLGDFVGVVHEVPRPRAHQHVSADAHLEGGLDDGL
jgi:hypothetical protein